MKYAKPELLVTTAAVSAIQGQGKVGLAQDNIVQPFTYTAPAYEADE
jgi:hypothetical protein